MTEPVVTGSVDPVAGFKFSVKLGEKTVAWFTECSGLAFERTVLPHEEGGVNDRVHQLPGRVERTRLSLKRGLADNALMAWFIEGQHDGSATARDVSVLLFDAQGIEAGRWNLQGVYPLKWQGAGPVVESDQVAVETLEIGSGEDSTEPATAQRAADAPSASSSRTTRAEVDLPALAEQIVTLLKQDLRIERERLPRGPRSLGAPW